MSTALYIRVLSDAVLLNSEYTVRNKKNSYFSTINIHSLVFSPQAGLAGTRTQSGDRYGSCTLHPGQVLRGRLPLLSPIINMPSKKCSGSEDTQYPIRKIRQVQLPKNKEYGYSLSSLSSVTSQALADLFHPRLIVS